MRPATPYRERETTTPATPTAPPETLRPYLTPRHELLWQEAELFAEQYVAPRIPRLEHSTSTFDRRLAQLMGRRGWFGVTVPAAHGGLEIGHVAKTILIHRISVMSAAAGAILQATLIPVGAVEHFGTREQKTQWLPRVADGSALMSIAVTEPTAGGHIGGMETVAEREGDAWVITGSKAHIGNVHIADVHVVVARTGEEGKGPSQALTAFLVVNDLPGVSVTAYRAGHGLRGFSAGQLDLDHVRVEADQVLGEVGQGMEVAQHASIRHGRPNLAAVSLGIHDAVMKLTTAFLKARPRYGATLLDLPVLQDRLGAITHRLHAARILLYHAAHLLDHGIDCDPDLINAKYSNHAWAIQSCQDAMELHGARALDPDYPLQRLIRDIQHTYAPAGTGEFQRIHLARSVLGTASPPQ
ncbi:acyl-CoA dehydrogenase family protein [Streptomyces sp. NPDC001642]|uniref:acyl-CoA dehydrogenase family protein n=1 Tax=Streptomyces sp. NPDC001642 TaxID=3154392 RepID=UPI003323A4E9